MKQNLHNIFNTGKCPESDDFQLYLSGGMSSEDANALEQHVEGCEMCADALEGLKAFSETGDIKIVGAELDKRVDELLVEGSKPKLFPAWYKIAAAIAVLFMVGGLLFINNQFNHSNEKIFSEHYEPFEKKDELEKGTQEEESTVGNNNRLEQDTENKNNVVTSDVMAEEQKALKVAEKLSVPPAVNEIAADEVVVLEDVPNEPEQTEMAFSMDADAEAQMEEPAENALRDQRIELGDDHVDGIVITDDKKQSVPAMTEEVQVQSKDKSLFQKRAKNLEKEQAEVPANVQGDVTELSALGNSSVAANNNLISEYYTKGETEYETKNYRQAKLWFEKALAIDTDHYQSAFYTGICALQLEQTDESITHLSKVIEKENEVLYEPALWYLSLAHIKKEDTRKAKKYLKRIVPLNGEYKKKAEDLLQDL